MKKPELEAADAATHDPTDENARRALRRALGNFPTGVAIVTALAENSQPIGITINSFASVSLSPPLISWCIDRRAASYQPFSRATDFAVTVLSAGQEELATRFATRGANKFRDIDVCCNQAPVIPGGCAWFRCKNSNSLLLGDHRMLIGRVIEHGSNSGAPLVFSNGQFQSLVPQASLAAA